MLVIYICRMNPGKQQTIFFAHANGFPAPSYASFFSYLTPHSIDYVEVFGLKNPAPTSWEQIAEELIRAIEARHDHPVIGLGHSFGGVGTFFAARRRPDLFSKIILLDPPFFGWKRRWLVAPFQWIGLAHKVVPPAKVALKRRADFTSKEEARAYFSKKRFFQTFTPEAFEDYLEHALIQEEEKVTLRIPKKQEAQFFASLPSKIGDTTLSMPAHFIIPEGKGIIPTTHLHEIRARFSNMRWHSTPGNHMFPLEYPKETAELIQKIL